MPFKVFMHPSPGLSQEEEDECDKIAEGRSFSSSRSEHSTSSQDASSELRTDQAAAQIRHMENAEESYKDDAIIKASEDKFKCNSTLQDKEDADNVAVLSTKFVSSKLPCDHERKTASNEDQSLKSILKRKANGNNHAGGTNSVKQDSFDDLAYEEDFHEPSKGRKDTGNAAVKSRIRVRFDLPCKDDGEGTLKKHQDVKSFVERKSRMKKMQRLSKLNPKSLSALAQLARLIAEMQQTKEGSSPTLVEETKALEDDFN